MNDPVRDPVRWGVLGATSWIFGRALLPALRDSETARIVATASRTGAGHDSAAPRRYGGYAELLADPDVEVVYLPLPNDLHEPWTLAAAAAGKHVLCEKPLAPDAAAARRMAQACASHGVALVEAYMTPFHPRTARWDALVDDGVLGTPRFGVARFTFPQADLADYRWRPDAGGGALLDLGIYCLEPLLRVAGWQVGDAPPAMAADAVMSERGVDASFAGLLSFPSGFSAAFCCSFDAPEAQTLEVVGTDATMRIEPAFTPAWDDQTIVATGRDGTTTTIDTGPGAMYTAMVDHVNRVVRGSEPQRRPPSTSVALAELIDLLRATAAERSRPVPTTDATRRPTAPP